MAGVDDHEYDSSDEILIAAVHAAAVAVLAVAGQRRQARDRSGRPWTGPVTTSRRRRGAFYTTVPELIDDGDDTLPAGRVDTFRNYFRIDRADFDMVLEKVKPLITKQDTHYRDSISAKERLMVTLRYLATGSSMTQLHYDWCLSVSSLSQLIPETCDAIYKVLKSEFLRTPSTEVEWKAISAALEDHWNFPNAIGALDGKHIIMNKPWHAGSEYYNYKGQESIVLMAMCDANYSFTYIDVGAQGRASDGGVFGACTLKQAIDANSINIPPPRCPPHTDEALPYVILGDEAFPLKTYLMRPYPRRTLTNEKRIFNYRLSRVRRLIENAFGILAATWRILLRRIDLEPDKIQKVVLACCALHNLIRRSRTPPQRSVPQIGPAQEREQVHPAQPMIGLDALALRPAEDAKVVRDKYCVYVNTVGAVNWQRDMVTLDDE